MCIRDSINAITYTDFGLTLGGEFSINPIVGYYGNNLASYDLTGNFLTALGQLNAPVENVISFGNDFYFAGQFTGDDIFPAPLPYIAKMATVTDVKEIDARTIKLFPNPATDYLNVEGLDGVFEYAIYDLAGKELKTGISNNRSIVLEGMPTGMLLVRLRQDEQSFNFKVLKQY